MAPDERTGGWASVVRQLSDEAVARPLWEFPPGAAKAVESERARRGLLRIDTEPIGDAEFS